MENFAKFLDLLKARPGQLSGLAFGAAAFAGLLLSPLMPTSSDGRFVWMAAASALACLAAGLAIGSAGEWVVQQAWRFAAGKLRSRRNKATFRAYIPYLTATERQILGYLLHHRQKTLEIAMDGGHAAGLVARGFIQFRGVAGQAFDLDNRVAIVPEDVWAVMEEQSSDFSYTPEFAGSGRTQVETHPWRVHWMERG